MPTQRDGQRQAAGERGAHGGRRALGLAHVHVDDHAQVVVGRDAEFSTAMTASQTIPRSHGGPEQVELADEAGQRRDADQREQEEAERRRQQRMAPRKAGVVARPRPPPRRPARRGAMTPKAPAVVNV